MKYIIVRFQHWPPLLFYRRPNTSQLAGSRSSQSIVWQWRRREGLIWPGFTHNISSDEIIAPPAWKDKWLDGRRPTTTRTRDENDFSTCDRRPRGAIFFRIQEHEIYKLKEQFKGSRISFCVKAKNFLSSMFGEGATLGTYVGKISDLIPDTWNILMSFKNDWTMLVYYIVSIFARFVYLMCLCRIHLL